MKAARLICNVCNNSLQYVLQSPIVRVGACERGFRGFIVPGPGPRGPELKGPGRVQVSALCFGIAPQHRDQTCLHQKCQSAYLVLVIGRYFCYTASNSGRFD